MCTLTLVGKGRRRKHVVKQHHEPLMSFSHIMPPGFRGDCGDGMCLDEFCTRYQNKTADLSTEFSLTSGFSIAGY